MSYVNLHYDNWQFTKPATLSENEYLSFRKDLTDSADDANYNQLANAIDRNFKGFLEAYKSRLIIFVLGVFLMIVAESFNSDILTIIAAACLIGYFFFFILTIPSYLFYKSERKKYYKELSTAILESDDYIEFLTMSPNIEIDI